MKKDVTAFVILLTLAVGINLQASERTKVRLREIASVAEVAPEVRESTAQMYEEMGRCLNSARSWEECHKQLQKSCLQLFSKSQCPTMTHYQTRWEKLGQE